MITYLHWNDLFFCCHFQYLRQYVRRSMQLIKSLLEFFFIRHIFTPPSDNFLILPLREIVWYWPFFSVFLISKRFLPWNIFHNKITEPALCISYQAPSLPETDLNNFPLRIQVFPRIPRYPLSYAMGTGTAFCIDWRWLWSTSFQMGIWFKFLKL